MTLQAAYRHMDIEFRLLNLGGESAKSQILSYKNAGIKTEPAFAEWLGINGDPYAALLQLSQLTSEELVQWYRRQPTATAMPG